VQKIFILFVSIYLINHCNAQLSKLNDSVYLRLVEDSSCRFKLIPSIDKNKVNIGFGGEFRKDLVRIIFKNKIAYSEILSTVDINEEWIYPKAKVQLDINKGNKFRFEVNEYIMEIPLKKDYQLLYIYQSPEIIQAKNVTVFSIRYTNNYVQTL
jgi:hypothetical protein